MPRIAVGVSAAGVAPETPDRFAMPVTGVFLTAGQGEYGLRRLHDLVTARLRAWLATKDCAPLELETRLDSKVTARAAAWNWPAVLAAEQTVHRGLLDELWDWCGRQRAAPEPP